jgi:hypothetical protein
LYFRHTIDLVVGVRFHCTPIHLEVLILLVIKYRQQQPLLFHYQLLFNKVSIVINLTVFSWILKYCSKILLKIKLLVISITNSTPIGSERVCKTDRSVVVFLQKRRIYLHCFSLISGANINKAIASAAAVLSSVRMH